VRRVHRHGLAIALALLALIAGVAWWRIGVIDVAPVAPGLYLMTGVGGNVTVLVTDAGAAVVDSMTFVRQGRAIMDRVRELTPKPVLALLNTHYHFDHTHGNPAFPVGTRVIATLRTLQRLRTLDADFWHDQPARQLLPNSILDGSVDLHIGNKTVRALSLGRGHTDGDLVVLFVEDRVLAAGDLFFNGYWPNIDLEGGASVREWPATLDRVLALDFDRVIPGHGPMSDRAGLERFRDFLRSLWTQTEAVVARGGSLADARREVDLDRFGMTPLWFAPYLNRRFVIGRTFEEASHAAAARRAP
jgi:glyoxylase-like metal-dependent hydrolase (beta-lactamase superfamily II)